MRISALFAIIISGILSASAVDYQALRSTDPATLATLNERFVSGDTTLTVDEVATVYYTTVFAPGYSSRRDYSAINAMRADRRYAEMLPLCEEALKSDPVSLTLLFRTFAAAFNHPDGRKTDLLENARTRVNQVCDAIFASGKGVIEDSPFEVVAEADIEQFLTNYLQVDAILGTANQGELTVTRVRLPGQSEPIFLYFRVHP